jgi:hypothetical protein
MGDLDVEFIVGLNLLNHAGPNPKDLQHASSRTSEDDHGQHDDNQDSGTQRRRVHPCKPRSQRNTHSSAQACPE